MLVAPRWPIRQFLAPRGLILPRRDVHRVLHTSVRTEAGFLQAFVLFNEADGRPEWALQRDLLLSPTGSLQTYTSRNNWNNANNQIEVVAAGGAGAHGASTSTGGGGAAGGGYNSISNFAFASPGTTTAQYQIGAGGLHGGTFPQNGGDTWFNAAAFPSSGTAVGAKGGPSPSTNTTATGGTAVATTSFFPTTSPPARAGGNGASGTSASVGGGGGGAGGPNGAGGTAPSNAGGTADGGTVSGGSAGNPGTANVGNEWTSSGCGSGAGGSNASGGTGGNGPALGGGAGGGSRLTGTGGDGGNGGIILTWLSPWWNVDMGDAELTRKFFRMMPYKTA